MHYQHMEKMPAVMFLLSVVALRREQRFLHVMEFHLE
jgi:hypothetical protein